jgi:hypothetical protein
VKSNPTPDEILKLIQQGRHLTTKQAALYLNLSERTLEAYRYLKREPHFIRVNHHIRYPASCLADYIANIQKNIENSTIRYAKTYHTGLHNHGNHQLTLGHDKN